ncbi:MAG: carboxypeptidase-like regulatory domain-containing protein [Smithellaceae bacterium]
MHKPILVSLRTHVRTASLIALLVALWAACAVAQVDTGNIVGTVHDPTGAAVPDARVVVTNLATHVSQTTQTNSEGQYVVLLVQVGTYSVSVEKTGFQKSIESGIKVDVQAHLQVDFTLRSISIIINRMRETGRRF